jgi:hypothetical protein
MSVGVEVITATLLNFVTQKDFLLADMPYFDT